MVREDKLSDVLSEFARTVITDFPIQRILDHLVQRIVGVLSVTGSGVTLISPGAAPYYVAASDELALRFERLQSEFGQGPCLTAYDSGEAVAVPDLAVDARYPQFGPVAVAAGMAAVFTFPLRHATGRLGALDLYRDTTGPLDAEDMAAAQTLADVAAAYLLNAQSREDAREVRDRFAHSALHDPLTGLPNRVLLAQRLEHAAALAERSHSTAAVLFADLDRFKWVNDTYGHSTGDALLVAVADRLTALLRAGDTLARVSGDEFVILCEDMADASDVERLATRIDEAFTAPFALTDAELSITASIGIAYAGPGRAVSNQLVIDADTAMYQAKRKGGAAHQVIDLRAADQAHQRIALDQDLRAALGSSHLDVAYQPIVRAANGLVTGVEALLRWTHPDKGPIPALTAISIAEQTGFITKLGAWVLERGCRDRTRWLAEHPDRPLDLSVNVSARQLMGPGFVETVAAVLARTGMDPGALVLELTEGIFIDDGDRAMSVLIDLKTLGVRLALDDFGTGYCSMAYLRHFPVDIIKIDQGFVADINSDPAVASVVTAVANLAHVLGMSVTAEGIETEQQRKQVAGIGCESAQGFLYARPLTGVRLSAELARDPGRPLRLPRASNEPLPESFEAEDGGRNGQVPRQRTDRQQAEATGPHLRHVRVPPGRRPAPHRGHSESGRLLLHTGPVSAEPFPRGPSRPTVSCRRPCSEQPSMGRRSEEGVRVRISDVLKTKGHEILTLDASATVRELIEVLGERRIGAVLISAEGRVPVGIVSERDVVRRLHEQAEQLLDKQVSSIMTADVVMCSPTDDVDLVLQTMTERRFRHMPVMEKGRVVGVVSIGDLVKSRIGELQLERDQLSNYISGSP